MKLPPFVPGVDRDSRDLTNPFGQRNPAVKRMIASSSKPPTLQEPRLEFAVRCRAITEFATWLVERALIRFRLT